MVGLDFDGTLAPIVDDPEQAYADQAAVGALGRLGRRVGAVVVITGRPVRTAVRLGRFAEIDGLGSMIVMGQYGVERWDATDQCLPGAARAAGHRRVAEELPNILDSLGLGEAPVEHKGRALGVHTRTLEDPARGVRAADGPPV